METRKFHTVDEAITEAGHPPLFCTPCDAHWENEGEFNPDSLIIKRDALEDGGALWVSLHDDVWETLNRPTWTETDATLALPEQRIEFTLRFDDDRTVVDTTYVAVLLEFNTRHVVVKDWDLYVCTAQYVIHRKSDEEYA